MKATVLGAGSWGTALSILLARNSHEVTLVGRNRDEIDSLRSLRENLQYLPGFVLPKDVSYALIGEEPAESDICVIAVPAVAVREMVRHHSGSTRAIVICSKGLEPVTSMLMTEVVKEMKPDQPVGVLSGPNLAIEIAQGIPTVAIAAFERHELAREIQTAFTCSTFRVSIGDDLIGVELGGALKNVLAIGAGMSDGLGFGDNTKGAFLSRGLMEMAKLGEALGARAETFLGPAGVGDLFATANSSLSRNYRIGEALGKGASLTAALQSLGQVAEGVPTSESVQFLARKTNVEMPVFAAVEGVIRGHLSPSHAVSMLMERAPRAVDFLEPKNA